MVLTLAYIVVLSTAAAIPSPVEKALVEGAPTGTRVVITDYRPANGRAGCAAERAELPKPMESSGLVSVRITGRDPLGERCEAWGWARIQLFAPTFATTRTVAAGQSLDGAITQVEREVFAGRAPARVIAPGSVATRALPEGTMIEPHHVRAAGPAFGSSVNVVVRLNGLSVAQRGTVSQCTADRVCAILPNGRRVEGTMVEGRLVVEVP